MCMNKVRKSLSAIYQHVACLVCKSLLFCFHEVAMSRQFLGTVARVALLIPIRLGLAIVPSRHRTIADYCFTVQWHNGQFKPDSNHFNYLTKVYLLLLVVFGCRCEHKRKIKCFLFTFGKIVSTHDNWLVEHCS